MRLYVAANSIVDFQQLMLLIQLTTHYVSIDSFNNKILYSQQEVCLYLKQTIVYRHINSNIQ